MSMEQGDKDAAAVAVAPRVTLADIEAAISSEAYISGEGILFGAQSGNIDEMDKLPASVLTVCLLVLRNGFTVIGKSAPASPENFNSALGRKFAKEDAMRQLWPLMGYALRDRLHTAKK